MKEFFSDFLFWKPYGFWEWAGLFLLWVLTITIAFLILLGVYMSVNYIGVGKKEGTGVVIGKTHRDPYITTTYVKSGETMIPITQYHPEHWGLVISVSGKDDEIGVYKDFQNSTKIGSTIKVIYKTGRIDNEVEITDIK